jgi:hypothetical protein
MTFFITRFKKYFIYWIFSLLVLPVFFWGYSHAASDLLHQMFLEVRNNDMTIDLGDNVNTVWSNTFKTKKSIIVRSARLLLILTIALSVTMILYNGMIYIIETWQGKEWKSLVKNVIFIVVWILIALFSSVIIILIQSIPETLDEELKWSPTDDRGVLDK